MLDRLIDGEELYVRTGHRIAGGNDLPRANAARWFHGEGFDRRMNSGPESNGSGLRRQYRQDEIRTIRHTRLRQDKDFISERRIGIEKP